MTDNQKQTEDDSCGHAQYAGFKVDVGSANGQQGNQKRKSYDPDGDRDHELQGNPPGRSRIAGVRSGKGVCRPRRCDRSQSIPLQNGRQNHVPGAGLQQSRQERTGG